MKLTLIILLVASCQAAKVTNSRSKDRIGDFETEKRDSNRNSGLEKRTPLLPSVSSSATPGVEYASTKETHSDQSPSQQIYATPVPQLSKISDVLAQGGPYQAAIANQLYSPVSIYQPRFPTYEVSPPVPSQLAYAEHSIQPQNIQSIPKANLAANYQPQIFQQYETSVPQPIPANYQQTASPISNQPINYQQPLIQYQQYTPDQLQFVQESIQPQTAYRQELPVTYQGEQARPEPQPVTQNIQQTYTPQSSQGAISYASFAQNQRDQVAQKQQQSQYQPQAQQLIKYQLQHQPIQYQLPQVQQPQYQAQPQQYQIQQYEAPQYQIQQQPYQQYQQSEGRVQYQPQLPPLQIQPYQPQYVKSKQNEKQVYFKQLQQPAVVQQIQPQLQPQAAQTKVAQQYSQAPAQNAGYAAQVALPTFPPVQYFGKFAHSIFGQQ
ncbi:altered inheritance of mitochondria protein 3-like [Pieris rapae]|uniref:altered inheritance of mitochondria protein 3-like n=1 Tax=Pieris rapae TaxID=64459 RepID=UPI001E280E3C|nr:altered inheritance of mitochondria protein 3-like [Pieris rapae]